MTFNLEKIIKAIVKYFDFPIEFRVEKVEKPEFNFGELYVFYQLDEPDRHVVIKYVDDIMDLKDYEKSMYNRLGIFLENAGYGENKEYLQVMLTLHEFGHVDYVLKMEAANSVGKYNVVNECAKDVAAISFSPDRMMKLREEGVDIPYMLRGDEMYADAFAMKYFIPVINILREKGLVE